MKLYIKPGACSLSPHIIAREAGIPVEVIRADTKSEEFRTLNPKGYIPVLQLDDGQVLTEGAVIAQYLADQKPASQLAPRAGSMERYRLQEWLNYVATEIHKGFSPLFRKPPAEFRAQLVEGLEQKFAFLANRLEKSAFVAGEKFSVVDAYLYTVLTWSKGQGIELAKWPALKAWFDKIAARPAVQEAQQNERA